MSRCPYCDAEAPGPLAGYPHRETCPRHPRHLHDGYTSNPAAAAAAERVRALRTGDYLEPEEEVPEP